MDIILREKFTHSKERCFSIETLVARKGITHGSRIENLETLVAKLIERDSDPANFIRNELLPYDYDFVRIK